MKKLLLIILLFPNLLFSWTVEEIRALTDNCIEKTLVEAPQFSDDFILEYCDCSIIHLKKSMTWDEYVSLYYSNRSLLTEKLINSSVICAEKLLSQGKT